MTRQRESRRHPVSLMFCHTLRDVFRFASVVRQQSSPVPEESFASSLFPFSPFSGTGRVGARTRTLPRLGGWLGCRVAGVVSFSAVPFLRGGAGSAGTAREGTRLRLILHLRHGQAPLKKKRAGARLSARRQVSLFVKVWPFSGGGRLRIVRSQLWPRFYHPAAREAREIRFRGPPRPGRFERAGRFRRRSVGTAQGRPLLMYPELRPKSYAAPHVLARRGAETGPLARRANVVPYLRLLKTGDRIPDGTFYPLLAVLQIWCTFSETLESARKFDF